MIGAVAARLPIPLTQRPRDPLTWPQFRFAKTCFALIRRIPQDAPHGGSLATRRCCPRRNLPFVQ